MLSIEYLTMEQSPQLLFLKKSKNITAKILEYVPFSLSLSLSLSLSGKLLAAEHCCHMNYHHRWWLYKHVEQPRVPLAINTPA